MFGPTEMHLRLAVTVRRELYNRVSRKINYSTVTVLFNNRLEVDVLTKIVKMLKKKKNTINRTYSPRDRFSLAMIYRCVQILIQFPSISYFPDFPSTTAAYIRGA